MESILKFKSNINCMGCKSKVQTILELVDGISNWNVDLEDEDRVLSIQSKGINSEEVISLVKKVGFQLVEIK